MKVGGMFCSMVNVAIVCVHPFYGQYGCCAVNSVHRGQPHKSVD